MKEILKMYYNFLIKVALVFGGDLISNIVVDRLSGPLLEFRCSDVDILKNDDI